jgi:hypothetical protein
MRRERPSRADDDAYPRSFSSHQVGDRIDAPRRLSGIPRRRTGSRLFIDGRPAVKLARASERDRLNPSGFRRGAAADAATTAAAAAAAAAADADARVYGRQRKENERRRPPPTLRAGKPLAQGLA